ncbi:MAG: ribokinase [Actinomycetota bacterium]
MTDYGGVVGQEIVVVGSINLDLSVSVDRFPEAGETVLGGSVLHGGGGKGANQAVAAARLGRRVLMVGRVGDDGGHSLVSALERDGVDVSAIQVTNGVASGMAIIEVDAAGENRIVVAPGANGHVSPDDLGPAADAIGAAPVILAQLEVPVEAVQALAGLPRTGRLVVNPAPVTPGYDVTGVDILVPNRGELAGLLDASGAGGGGAEAATVDEVVDQARRLAETADLEAVVVTLGGDGALVVDGLRTGSAEPVLIPAEPVSVVDTTAAGDSFCAGLADALCLGADVAEAARWAAKVAAVTVTRRGAQASLPTRADILT